jgi:hypothetical protein
MEPEIRERSRIVGALLFACSLGLFAGPAAAQPFGAWLTLTGADSTYISIPHSPSLNPTGGFTFEAWVSVTDAGGCSSIAGKNWHEAWWVGVCGTTLRSYLRGEASQKEGGKVPAGKWTHIAVTWDGGNRRHYVNGELVGTFAEATPPTTSTDPLSIASDSDWRFTPSTRSVCGMSPAPRSSCATRSTNRSKPGRQDWWRPGG